MQKWEYRVIREIHDEPVCYDLTEKGALGGDSFKAILKALPKGTKLTEYDVIAQNIARLGEEGWEMVTAGSRNCGSFFDLYFKRPKSE